MVALSDMALAQRARSIRLVVTDNDGVLTDGTVFVGPAGEALLQFSRRDGMGFELLRGAGIATAILTREESPIVAQRAAKLGVNHLWMGVRDKAHHLDVICREAKVWAHEIAYVGDDVNDLGIIELVRDTGLVAAPADAVRSICDSVHYISSYGGGRGAFRDVADWLLTARTKETV